MFRRSNRTGLGRPSPAMVVACIALFMGLSGVGYAAAKIGSAQIKNNSVKGVDIKNKTIKTGDIAVATRNELKGQTGPAGAAGAKGATGSTGGTGLTGPRGPSNVRTAVDADIGVPTCAGALSTCAPLLQRTLPGGNWLITARFLLDNNDNAQSLTTDSCGISNTFNSSIDTVRVPSLGITGQPGEAEVVALTGTLASVGFAQTVDIRCNEAATEDLFIEDAKITAIQVETITTTP
jgi:hypothetical protein